MRRVFVVISLMLAATSMLGASSGIAAQGGGYDEWGYNYTAKRFSGNYCQYLRQDIPCGYEDVHLDMQWNDAWLSKDRERPDDYIGSGAWLTNHMRGEYIGEDGNVHTWTYFSKIVAKPTADYSCEANGGEEIWDDFCVVQEVESGSGRTLGAVNPGLGH